MKNIAVCISGEHRTFDLLSTGIKQFFNLPDANIKYFGHVWNSNSYKMVPHTPETMIFEEAPVSTVLTEMKKCYDFEKLEVEEKFNNIIDWDHLFYSEAKSNLFKKQYELKHNMTFDVVVKCRTDLVFQPNLTFDYILNENNFQEKTIYSGVNIITKSEGYLPNVDDVFYYGSSYTMDMLQSNMFFVNRDFTNTITKYKYFDASIVKKLGPGVRQWQWLSQNNIISTNIQRYWFIYRKFMYPTKITEKNYHNEFHKSLGVYQK